MKQIKGLFFATMMVICFTSFSQNNNVVIDSRLKQIYSEAELNQLKDNAPDKILYYNLFLNNYCSIQTVVPEDAIFIGDINTIKLKNGKDGNIDPSTFDIKTFNLLKYSIPLDKTKSVYYSIGETNQYLVFISTEKFRSIVNTKK